MLLGVHCSVSGGLENSFAEAEKLGVNTFQIFTRNQRQWKAKPIEPAEAEIFKKAWAGSKAKVIFSHTSYLINLAAEDEDIRSKSINALREEVVRCTQLGLAYCVLHPGAAGTQSVNLAIARIAAALNTIIEDTADSKVQILLENTAGQGTTVGGTFENLARIRESVESDRIGYCFDTCHAFVAGYDIRTHVGFEETMDEFDRILGIDNLKVFHLNDSKGDFDSHLDRHEHIGKGHLGLVPFREIMRLYPDKPKVLETPKEDEMDAVNLSVLHDLL